MVLKQLVRVGGPVPEDLEKRVHGLSLEGLGALGEALLGFHSLQHAEAWLDAHEEFAR